MFLTALTHSFNLISLSLFSLSLSLSLSPSPINLINDYNAVTNLKSDEQKAIT
jgi:hypothetical protein